MKVSAHLECVPIGFSQNVGSSNQDPKFQLTHFNNMEDSKLILKLLYSIELLLNQ